MQTQTTTTADYTLTLRAERAMALDAQCSAAAALEAAEDAALDAVLGDADLATVQAARMAEEAARTALVAAALRVARLEGMLRAASLTAALIAPLDHDALIQARALDAIALLN